VTVVHNFLGESNIPVRLNSVVPGKSENLVQEGNLALRLNFTLSVKSCDFFLKHFSDRIVHVFNGVKHLLVLDAVTLLSFF